MKLTRMIGLAIATGVVAAGLVMGSVGAYIEGGWPETCLEMNDMVEASPRGSGAVGIYQRAFGDQAEAACRRDHLEDVRTAFAWAIPTPANTPIRAEQPVSQTPAPPQINAQSHPDFERIRKVALARGANVDLAFRIAVSVVTRNTIDAFLRGQDTGVEHGDHNCQDRSDACPLASPPPVIVKGEGEGDSVLFHLESGTYRVDVRYWDNRNYFGSGTNFIMEFCQLGEGCRLVVNEIAVSGQKSFNWSTRDGMKFVRARSTDEEAKWEVKLKKI